jgi:hydroxymethylglutaryl-CoA lyase
MPNDEMTIIECPRDAWQALPRLIPTEVKADYLRALIAAGFRHIDAVSLVSPKAVPQMADSEQVLLLTEPPPGVEMIGIVMNEKGATRAIDTGAITTLGFPYSISPVFLERNQHQTPDECLDALDQVAELGYRAGLNLVVYISMAFGNPYGDAWSLDEVVEACRLLSDMGVTQISLADTVGVATPEQVHTLVTAVADAGLRGEFGVHLHARPDEVAAKVQAAYAAGCRRFDMAMGGLGGCPFAQDLLVGNLATETALAALRKCGATLPDFDPLGALSRASQEIARQYGLPIQ